MVFRFKKEKKETGLRSTGHLHPNTVIKLGTKKVGWIHAPSWSTKDGKWGIWLHVKGNAFNPNCTWHNQELSPRFETEPEARAWLQQSFGKLVELGLHEMED